jgi:hypothetical protein
MRVLVWFFLVAHLTQTALSGTEFPVIQSFATDGTLTWSSGSDGGLDVIELTPSLSEPAWMPYFYELASAAARSMQIPLPADFSSFFVRIRNQNTVPDPSLVLHLSFDNALDSGLILDISGHGHHARRYSPTNWPSPATGPDGRQAGYFRRYDSLSGDYAAVLKTPLLDGLATGAIAAWARYDSDSYHASAIVDGHYHTQPGSWLLGRVYEWQTSFLMVDLAKNEYRVIRFPDKTTSADRATDGWHHYCVTFDGTTIRGYFDGREIGSASQAPYPLLNISRDYVALGCWPHNGTPQWGDDAYPNNGWMHGAIDDVRIYNRALTGEEVRALYHSFDRQPPAPPTNVTLRTESSSQIKIRWTPATDPFGIAGYMLYRDGFLIATGSNPYHLDEGLSAGQVYAYSVRAFDPSGNISDHTEPVTVSTLPLPGQADIILDDDDPPQFVSRTGNWVFTTLYGGYWERGYVHDDAADKGNKTFTFRPSIPETGDYSLFARWVARSNRSTSTPIVIETAFATNTVFVNQRNNNNVWVPLGAHQFAAGTNGIVQIQTTGTSGYVVVDAIRLMR